MQQTHSLTPSSLFSIKRAQFQSQIINVNTGAVECTLAGVSLEERKRGERREKEEGDSHVEPPPPPPPPSSAAAFFAHLLFDDLNLHNPDPNSSRTLSPSRPSPRARAARASTQRLAPWLSERGG
jgi:hypothetical protein